MDLHFIHMGVIRLLAGQKMKFCVLVTAYTQIYGPTFLWGGQSVCLSIRHWVGTVLQDHTCLPRAVYKSLYRLVYKGRDLGGGGCLMTWENDKTCLSSFLLMQTSILLGWLQEVCLKDTDFTFPRNSPTSTSSRAGVSAQLGVTLGWSGADEYFHSPSILELQSHFYFTGHKEGGKCWWWTQVLLVICDSA